MIYRRHHAVFVAIFLLVFWTTRTTSIPTCLKKPPVVEREWLSDGVKNGMASGLASALVKCMLQPFDAIKTVQQAQGIRSPIVASSIIFDRKGLSGFWTGFGFAVLGSSPSMAIYFGVYSSVKKSLTLMFPPHFSLAAVAIAASVGEQTEPNNLVNMQFIRPNICCRKYNGQCFESTLRGDLWRFSTPVGWS